MLFQILLLALLISWIKRITNLIKFWGYVCYVLVNAFLLTVVYQPDVYGNIVQAAKKVFVVSLS